MLQYDSDVELTSISKVELAYRPKLLKGPTDLLKIAIITSAWKIFFAKEFINQT